MLELRFEGLESEPGCFVKKKVTHKDKSVANDDQEMLEGSEAETYRSVVGILMYFKRHRFDLH